jgi:hypothetical protein
MVRKPLSPVSPPRSESETILPHDHDREGRQPYAKELEDYKHGVVRSPKEQAGQEKNPKRTKERNEKQCGLASMRVSPRPCAVSEGSEILPPSGPRRRSGFLRDFPG